MCRIAILIKLNMFGTAEAEMIAFGDLDNPDLFFEFYPEKYPNVTGDNLVRVKYRLLL